jgi:type I restriction enzyme S subunit
MIAGLKPYQEYKKSGSRWLGEVPSHWDIRNLRTLITVRSERNKPELPLLSVAREKGVFVRSLSGDDDNHNVIPEDLTNYKVARAGNLVINKMKAWQGSMGIAPCDGIVSPAYFVFDFRIAKPAFGQALLRSKPYVAHFGQASDGVRIGQWDLSIPGMRQIPILVPSEDEQAAIVLFLNHANGRIERAIGMKKKLIALLNEHKQAIIHGAVTRGLDPTVPLKTSGIPWLGDIPKHWEARRIKQISFISRGKFTHRPRNDPSLYDGPYPFIQTGAVARASKFITSYNQTLNERGLAVSKLFPSGTLCMTIAANIGDVAILDFEACFPDSIVGLVPRKGMDRDFLFFVLRCMKQEFLLEAPVNTQGNLNVERIGAMGLPLPPCDEQVDILRYVERETSSFDLTIERAVREIGLLREYRTRLIADVVTGKLDVREAAASLPEQAAEPEGISSEAEPNGDLLDFAEVEENDE